MIDPTKFQYDESRWADVYNHLKSNGVDVYAPMMKIGECQSPYVVVKMGTSAQYYEYSSDQDVYELLLYVPRSSYSRLEPYVQQVRGYMKELEPMIISRHSMTTSYYDDEVKAHMITLEYYNVKKC